MIKNTFLSLLIIVLSINLTAQEKYQGLLWEITGNGLTEKSYLYGTMHVSGKIAYHLGEEFFEGLKSVDAVALESNPIIWLDEITTSSYAQNYLGQYGISYQQYDGFYKEAFKIKVPEKTEFAQTIASNHYLTNWMLYRENGGNTNFEEETFLDMFIYQGGSKFGKPVYSLESFKQSTIFSMLSSIPDEKQKETSIWFEEMTKEKSYYEILQDAYRDQDLDMLDSLQKEVTSDTYLKYMLYERNKIIAKNIDSIIQSGVSLFSGIGAAHLPKKQGVIGLLREMGYTLKPIPPTINNKSKKNKEIFSQKKLTLPYNETFTSDLFSLKIPSKAYETPSESYIRDFFAPELTNGTFYTFRQISTYSYLKGKEKKDYLSFIDSLLFENIPGKIISKQQIVKDGYKGLNIINQTKTGDYQHYQIITSPLHVFIFKMGGKDDFVKTDGPNFFETIKLKQPKNDWEKITTIKNDFSVEVPTYYSIKNNTQITSLYSHPEIEAYDKENDIYYLLKRKSLHDFSFIETDKFELTRLINKFCEELDIDSVYSIIIDEKAKLPTAYGFVETISGKKMDIKVVIKGAYYYLLVSVADKENKENRFFNSFTIQNFTYSFPFEQKTDSILKFTVNSNYLSPNPYQQMAEKAYEKRRNKNKTEDIAFLREQVETNYYSENYENILVTYEKFHHYAYAKTADTIWNQEINFFRKKNELALKNKKFYAKNELNYADVTFIDTNSSRNIIKRYILNKGVMYTLTVNLDTTVKQPSKFVDQFFETFRPLNDSANQISVLTSKSDLFFNTLKGNDSLEKERALKSVESHIRFENNDAPRLMEVIEKYPFPAQHIAAKVQLIKDLGRLNYPGIESFLLPLYDKVGDTAMLQTAILTAVANMKTKKSTKNILNLLEKDIPISGNKWESSTVQFLSPYYDSLELVPSLYPKLLNYTFVQEYKNGINNLLSTAIDSNQIKAKKYKKQYKQILREAKISLKSQISYEQNKQTNEENSGYYFTSYKNQGNDELVEYTNLLIPFYEKKEVQVFFTKLEQVQDYSVQTDIACKLVEKEIEVPSDKWEYLANDIVNYAYLYKKLNKINRLDLLPKKVDAQLVLAKSLQFSTGFNFEKDSLEFIEKRKVETTKGNGYVYFFKTKKEKEDQWELEYSGLQPLNEMELSDEETFSQSGISIKKGKELTELIDEQIKEIEIYGHPRADESDRGSYNYGW